MPIPEDELEDAARLQQVAARDPAAQVRLVAGPGTGKSSSIEDRVLWLLTERDVPPHQIYALSFTRASTADLRSRIDAYCTLAETDSSGVHVSTVHSLALRLLRRAGRLIRFPAGPSVLDDWEVDNIFNAELSDRSGLPPTRCDDIRRHHEAMWSTGVWDPPNYIPPTPQISEAEVRAFTAFHGPATSVYSCVLPGELVRQCVEDVEAGLIDPIALLDFAHVIVDEYQDLNPFDQRFIEALTARGVTTFIAGDDDQSIYSFRFASPSGIQRYRDGHPGSASHTLEGCFRCTPAVVASAVALIDHYSPPSRLPKALRSLYERSDPRLSGIVHAWGFADDRQEARVIAESCSRLIDAGVAARQILILISNGRLQGSTIRDALVATGVPHEMPSNDRFVDKPGGRTVLSLLRVACDTDDYVAHRTLLGIQPGVGRRTCRQIAEKVVEENRNYRDLFYGTEELDAFDRRQRTAIESVAALLTDLVGWTGADTLTDRSEDLCRLAGQILGDPTTDAVRDVLDELPSEMTLDELRDFLSAEKDEAQARILLRVHQRAGRDLSEAEVLPARVRVMSMHGAKGLSAQVVFVPGLEEEILPGEKRRPYPGLVLEAARLLYVSITRGRAACCMSYSTHRRVYGRRVEHHASEYLGHSGLRFAYRATPLNADEIAGICDAIDLL